MKEVELPSGATLKISEAPFEEALALFDAILEESKSVAYIGKSETLDFLKSTFCTLLPSKKVKAALKPCMNRAIYNGARITDSTWEPTSARGDYLEACIAITEENIAPFGKSLYAQLGSLLLKLESIRK